jgi:hypothetical protein
MPDGFGRLFSDFTSAFITRPVDAEKIYGKGI